MFYNFIFFFVISINSVIGSGVGSTSIADLMYPTINFLIFFSFILYKTLPNLKQYFLSNHKTVKKEYEEVTNLSRDLKLKLESIQNKLSGFSLEQESIRGETEKDFSDWLLEFEKKSKERVDICKKDIESRISMEKNKANEAVNEEIVNRITSQALESIANDEKKKKKFTDKALNRIFS